MEENYQTYSYQKTPYTGHYANNATPNVPPTSNRGMQDKIDMLVMALGLMTGTIVNHKLDIEDEAYEEIMEKLITISTDAMSKLLQ